MKTKFFRTIAVAAVPVLTLALVPSADARPPRAIKAYGTVLAVDHETSTLVFKAGKGQKPFVLDWDKDRKFLKDGQAVTPDSLNAGASITIYYRRGFFGNPLLKKIQWEEKADGK